MAEVKMCTCPRCKGSGEEIDGEKVLTGLLTFGASMIVDAADNDDVITQPCRCCGGRGRVVASITTRGAPR